MIDTCAWIDFFKSKNGRLDNQLDKHFQRRSLVGQNDAPSLIPLRFFQPIFHKPNNFLGEACEKFSALKCNQPKLIYRQY